MAEHEQSVGVIGLGIMGYAVARCLLNAEWRVVGFDVDRRAQDRLAKLGGDIAESPADVTAAVDGPLLVLVRTAGDAEQVIVGEDGIATVRRPALVALMSTLGPSALRALADRAPAWVRLVDAPVSGGEVGAVEGSLTVMVGGASEDRRRLEPLFEVIGKTIVVAGNDPGAGQAIKLINQVVMGATMAAVAEAMELAGQWGVPEGPTLEALAAATGRSWVTENWERLSRYWEPSSSPGSLALIPQDMQLAIDEFDALHPGPDQDTTLPITAAAVAELAAARHEPASEGHDRQMRGS